MVSMSKMKIIYLIIFLVVVFVLSTGVTYAYLTATTSSGEDSVKTESTIYSISMNLSPLYNDFSFIPMNNEDAVKALRNECRDKYGRGACSAYRMDIYGYSENLNYVSGYMDVTTNNMANLSYMVYRISDTYDEETCVNINDKSYCVVQEARSVGDGVGLTLGDKYDVTGTESTEFILLVWLTNLATSQNDTDIGNFSAVVTMQAGSGGEIKGVISNTVVVSQDEEVQYE